MVSCSFIYPCWTGTTCCCLLTWAETKWVRQLIIHGAIISSINMAITRTSRGISQLKIPSHQENHPKRDCSHPQNSPVHYLRSCRVWMSFLRTVRLFNLARGIYPKIICLIQDGSNPSLLGIRRSISCLFRSTIPAKLCWLLRAVLRNLIPRNLILGVFIKMHSFVIWIWDLLGAHKCIECPLLFFFPMAWFVSSESRSHVLVSWLLWG